MKWVLNTTVGRATFSSGRKSRLVFRSCQQPRELDQGTWDAGKGTHSLLRPWNAVLLQGVSRLTYTSQPQSLPGEEVRGTAAEVPVQRCGTAAVQAQGGVTKENPT